MKRVLMIAYYFPPIGAAGSIRLAGMARELPALGWTPTVIAPRDTPHARDEQIEFPEDLVVRTRSLEWSRLGGGGASGGAEVGGNGTAGATAARTTLRSLATRFLYYPDGQLGWYPFSARAGRALLERERFDAIYSSAFPITAHLVARRLSRASGVPWLAEFRDPWSAALPADHPHRRRAERLERGIAKDAAAVVMTTQTWADHFGAEWGRSIEVVPNACDPVAARPSLGPEPAEPYIAHVGAYYAGRQDYSAVWTALRALVAAGVKPPRVRFIGNITPAMRDEFAAAGVSDLVDGTGYVPRDQVPGLMAHASLLIASGYAGDSPADLGVIPAKLFDYLGTDRPILYLGKPESEGARLLRGRPGCFVLDTGDADGVRTVLDTAAAGQRWVRDVSELSRAAAARRLAQVLDSIAG